MVGKLVTKKEGQEELYRLRKRNKQSTLARNG